MQTSQSRSVFRRAWRSWLSTISWRSSLLPWNLRRVVYEYTGITGLVLTVWRSRASENCTGTCPANYATRRPSFANGKHGAMLRNTTLHPIIAHRDSAARRLTQPQRHRGHPALYAEHRTASTKHSGAVPQYADDRTPALELVAPVGERRLGHHDQVRPVDLAELAQVGDDGNALQGFACRRGEYTPEIRGRSNEASKKGT
jgi:hypothetical protein